MWDQAWNCWLMQVRNVAVDRNTSTGAGSQGEASRHSAAKGSAGLNTCVKEAHARGFTPLSRLACLRHALATHESTTR